MDYAVGIFFFALGLGIALLLRGAWRFNKGEGGLGNLSVKDGVVRLDQLAGGAQKPEGGDGSGEGPMVPVAEPRAVGSGDAPPGERARRRPPARRPRK